MTSFNYVECDSRKNQKKDVSFTSYNILPANECDKISDYNV